VNDQLCPFLGYGEAIQPGILAVIFWEYIVYTEQERKYLIGRTKRANNFASLVNLTR
jgi:hypothetical protein